MPILNNFKNKLGNVCSQLVMDKDTKERQSLIEKLSNQGIHVLNNDNIKPICDLLSICKNDVCCESVFNDVEFFSSYANKCNKTSKSVFDIINGCELQGSKFISQAIYSNPTSDSQLLLKRQSYLVELEKIYSDDETRIEIDNMIATMRDHEHFISWLFEEREETIRDLYDVVFFRLKGLRPLNNSGIALTSYNLYRILLSPIFGIIAPIVYFIVPYIILLYKFKLKLPFKLYLRTLYYSVFQSSDTIFGSGKHYKYIRIASYLFSAVFYFQGIFNSLDVSRTVHKISGILINHLHGAVEYLKAAHRLSLLLWDSDKVCHFVQSDHLHDLHQETQFMTKILDSATNKYTIFSCFGNQLKKYKFIELPQNVAVIKSIIAKSYTLDALLGVIRYKKQNNASFANIIISNKERPHIHFIDMIHPCLNKKCVSNTIKLGEDHGEQNAIITSPNSSGKSILIKSLVVNILMVQTMTIQCATKGGCITPLTHIKTQMHIPDTIGYESLFEAEMHRCKDNLDMVEVLEKNALKTGKPQYSLIVMDEIFNSTNPIEAIAGAYAVCKRMAQYKSNILLFTTHFNYLTKLAKEKDCCFVNYRMQTIIDNKNISFTYKLEKGVNKHLLALELLRKSGFENSIIDDAVVIKHRLQTRK